MPRAQSVAEDRPDAALVELLVCKRRMQAPFSLYTQLYFVMKNSSMVTSLLTPFAHRLRYADQR